MLKSAVNIAAATVLTVGLGSPAFAAPADFVGTWVNNNSNTNSVTRLVISKAGVNKVQVRVFGKCHPTDCDWGTMPMLTYGLNVQDTNHNQATAVYNKGFANSLLTFGLSRNQLTLQNFTQFVDFSGRQNYYNRESFRKLTP